MIWSTALAAAVLLAGSAVGETPQANEQVLVAGGEVLPANSLISQPLHTSDGQVAGKINDLIFDLDEGHLALIVLAAERDVIGSNDQFLLPAALMHDLAANDRFMLSITPAELEAAPRASEAHDVSRKEASGVFAHFRKQPYWNEQKDNVSDADKFIPLSRLQKMEVHNARGKLLGNVRDLALTRKGKVAYVGVAREGAEVQIYPVPLSAFVAPKDDAHWILELPENVLEQTPTFPPTTWPKTLDRGWLEYVSVRYGQPVVGGINHELKSVAAKTEKAAQ